jgi:hypothetical protein
LLGGEFFPKLWESHSVQLLVLVVAVNFCGVLNNQKNLKMEYAHD